jgi:hypothetical protein
VSHTWVNPAPDFSTLVTDELVIFPWDLKVYLQGEWQTHPEILEAIKAQQKE